MYAIVDIETTGGSSECDRITEIAILIHDGHKITDKFITLINPEREIPQYITALTGITNEMVAGAPRFYEVARRIVELTDGKTFVAHNAGFDYNFIRNEFRSLGYRYQREQLCTVRLSRKLVPGLKSYSLGSLCNELGIEIRDRHRAAGDATATARLFDILIDLNNNSGLDLLSNRLLSENDLHPRLSIDLIRELPEETGLYYFYNEDNEVLYIGKSRNIKSRVISHINNNSSKRAMQMRRLIADIGYELTGSELIAILKESAEVRNKKPCYNRKRRTVHSGFMKSDNNNTIIVDRGRSVDEFSVIKIIKGKFAGYGYIDRDIQISHPDDIDSFISAYDNNTDLQDIVDRYLDNNRVIRVIKF
jgi:DNA polymerase-3 subunit epsilon